MQVTPSCHLHVQSSNINNRKWCEIWSELKIKIPKLWQWDCCDLFTDNFEEICCLNNYPLGYCIMLNFCKADNTTRPSCALLWDFSHNFKQTTLVVIVSLFLKLNVFKFPAAIKKLNKIYTFFFSFIYSRKNSFTKNS